MAGLSSEAAAGRGVAEAGHVAGAGSVCPGGEAILLDHIFPAARVNTNTLLHSDTFPAAYDTRSLLVRRRTI